MHGRRLSPEKPQLSRTGAATTDAPPAPARAHVGISGYDYAGWRGTFYPPDVPKRAWLSYASRIFDSIELNGTFYSLKSPAVFRRWVEETPQNFLFAVKGSRFITHNLKLARAEQALANFLASGVLALGSKTGPFLWQLPATYRFDAGRMERFLRLLPRSADHAASLARGHDDRLRRGALVTPAASVRFRHAFEVRHPTYMTEEFFALLRTYGCAYVVADTAGRFPFATDVTADFVYVRLHGSRELYVSGYGDDELVVWAERVSAWLRDGLEVFVYFDNDAKVRAPADAQRLMTLLSERGW
ncbi:MAG TPA: DUF72 domain-containing protein [Gemmatimonadaceae bacterium]|nr:DUF72 domain-containing protein [Gemmatimonadaceae bacterium]